MVVVEQIDAIPGKLAIASATLNPESVSRIPCAVRMPVPGSHPE
jgi:hypothetical protein